MGGISVEFLAAWSFDRIECADGVFYVRYHNSDRFLQVDEACTRFTEWNCGWVEDLTDDQFLEALSDYNNATLDDLGE